MLFGEVALWIAKWWPRFWRTNHDWKLVFHLEDGCLHPEVSDFVRRLTVQHSPPTSRLDVSCFRIKRGRILVKFQNKMRSCSNDFDLQITTEKSKFISKMVDFMLRYLVSVGGCVVNILRSLLDWRSIVSHFSSKAFWSRYRIKCWSTWFWRTNYIVLPSDCFTVVSCTVGLCYRVSLPSNCDTVVSCYRRIVVFCYGRFVEVCTRINWLYHYHILIIIKTTDYIFCIISRCVMLITWLSNILRLSLAWALHISEYKMNEFW